MGSNRQQQSEVVSHHFFASSRRWTPFFEMGLPFFEVELLMEAGPGRDTQQGLGYKSCERAGKDGPSRKWSPGAVVVGAAATV